MTAGAGPRVGCGAVRFGAAVLAAALAGGACVRLETAPGGVGSVRLEADPPSVVAGDVLRDSAGVPTAIRALAYDADGRELTTARVRFFYVPERDTTAGAAPDTALVVDSLTGAVRATLPRLRQQGRVAVRVGDAFQLLDTLRIVPAPDSLSTNRGAVLNTLRYNCQDPGTLLRPVPATGPDTARTTNVITLPAVTVFGRDTALGGRLMRWDVDSSPFPGNQIPRVPRVPGARDSVPAIAVVGGTTDQLRSLDTTDASGASTVRLRLRPIGLGRETVAASEFQVRVRVRGQPGPRPLANDPLYFRVRLARQPAAPGESTPACQ